MGTCKFCGRSAGFLRKQHAECAKKYQDGWNQMVQFALECARDEAIERPLLPALTEIAESHLMTGEQVRGALVIGWLQAVDEFLDDHLLTEAEEQKLVAFREKYELPTEVLRSFSAHDRLQKARALREILEGKFPSYPSRVSSHPFNFQKSEKIVWVFDSVKYYEDKTRREYVGGHAGASFRVMKGVYFRTGAFRGRPVDRTETHYLGTGDLAVTNKHLYFHSPSSLPDQTRQDRHDRPVLGRNRGAARCRYRKASEVYH